MERAANIRGKRRLWIAQRTAGRQDTWNSSQEGTEDLDVASASRTVAIAAALAGMLASLSSSSAGSAPLSSKAARAAQPASVTWVLPRWSVLSFVSTAGGGGGAPAGGGGATRAVRPSSPSG